MHGDGGTPSLVLHVPDMSERSWLSHILLKKPAQFQVICWACPLISREWKVISAICSHCLEASYEKKAALEQRLAVKPMF